MTISPAPHSASTQVIGHSRGQQGQVIMLDAFRRNLIHASERESSRTLVPASEQAAGSTDETRHEAQLKQELALAYADLGGATFALAHYGTLIDPRLASRVHRIYQLTAQLVASPDSQHV